MANLSTSGLEELIGGFDAIAEIPDEVVLEMLVAEALFMAPGEVFELWELDLCAHGKIVGAERG